MVSVVTEVNVDIDLDDIADDEIIEHLEERGYRVLFGNQKDLEHDFEILKDEIHALYRDYVSGGDINNKLKNFFSENLNVIVR